MLLPKVVKDQNGPILKLHKYFLPQFYCNLLTSFQRAVLEEAPLCNDWQITVVKYSGQICLCATYSAEQLQSAVHYLRWFFPEQPFEILWIYLYAKTYFLVNLQLQNVVTFSSILESSKSFRRGMTRQNSYQFQPNGI